MPDYKLYVMMNVFRLTDKEREAIIKRPEKPCGGAVALCAGLH